MGAPRWAEDGPAALTPIPEEVSPNRTMDDMAWLASGLKAGETPVSSGQSEEELIADLPMQLRGGVPRSPHADTPEGFLQFHLQLSREVCLLAERLENLERRVHSSAADAYVEAQ